MLLTIFELLFKTLFLGRLSKINIILMIIVDSQELMSQVYRYSHITMTSIVAIIIISLCTNIKQKQVELPD